MRNLLGMAILVCATLVMATTLDAGYPTSQFGYGYRSSVAPRTYLYGRGAPGLYPSRFGSGFGGYNSGAPYIHPGPAGFYYGYPGYYGGYGGNYGGSPIIINIGR